MDNLEYLREAQDRYISEEPTEITLEYIRRQVIDGHYVDNVTLINASVRVNEYSDYVVPGLRLEGQVARETYHIFCSHTLRLDIDGQYHFMLYDHKFEIVHIHAYRWKGEIGYYICLAQRISTNADSS